MTRANDLARLGQRMAGAQGIHDARPEGEWIAYGQACEDALARRRPVPAPLPAADIVRAHVASHSPASDSCPTCGQLREEAGSPSRRYMARVSWGLAWRYGILGTLVVLAGTQGGTPWPAIVAVVIAGLVLGLWHRPWAVARLWRATMVAGGVVYVAPIFPVYPDVLAGSLGALTLAPFVSAWRRR